MKLKMIIGAGALMLAIASGALAQSIEKKTLSLGDARKVMAAASHNLTPVTLELEDVALAGANALMTTGRVTSARFFDAAAVLSSFSRGAVLSNGDGANFQVHTSRRVQPGQAEVHTRETDIIYVIAGQATVVTGGSAIDLQSTAPDEFRGTRIDGGESRTLQKGDVIIVPAGTPHWFKEVTGELHYYVVKVS